MFAIAVKIALLLWFLLAAQPALAGGTLTYCVDPDWRPYELINERGEHQGIAADLLSLVAKRSGIDLQLVRTADWEESLAAARDGRCQALSFLNTTAQRRQWLSFTDPMFADPNVIITREEHSRINNLADIGQEILVLPEGTSIEERVRADFPNLRVTTTTSEAEAFAMVSAKQADLTLRSMSVAVDTIRHQGWFNLKVAGQVPGYDNLLRMGLRLDQADMVTRLNQAIATITPQERAAIANRHVSITVRTGIDPDLVRNAAVIAGVVLLTSLFWGLKLKALNIALKRQSRTDALTGLGNRAHLNDRLEEEFNRTARNARPLSLILFDLDHFKRINDTCGHLTGDRVLIDVAALLRAQARQADILGRWGGEEFLLVCPDTPQEQACILAERIRFAVEAHCFATNMVHTISGGVATMVAAETMDSVLARADIALYQAKALGRNRIEMSCP